MGRIELGIGLLPQTNPQFNRPSARLLGAYSKMKEFTVKNIIVGCYQIIASRWKHFATALSIPYVINIGATYLSERELSLTQSILILLVTIFIFSVTAIVTHRLVITPSEVPKWGLRKFGKDELFFTAFWIVLFGGLIAILVAVEKTLGLAPAIVLALVAVWVLARMSLAFPAIATGEYVSIRHSWNLSKSYSATMLMVVIFFPIVLTLFIFLLEFLLAITTQITGISAFLDPAYEILSVTAISLAYIHVQSESDA